MSDKPTWTTERRKLRDLKPWPINPREIKKDQAKRLQESFDQFGQVETIAIGPGNEIFNGHQRLNVLAAQHGPDYEVDVRVASRSLTEHERQKLTVFLHQGTVGIWNWDLLADNFEVADLVDWGFELDELGLHGFDMPEEEGAEDPGAQLDRAAELQEKWRVERGQVWEVGSHRVMCGDSTCAEDVERLMAGERAFCFTDPPYNVGKDYGDGTNDAMSPDEYLSWSASWFLLTRRHCDAMAFTPGAVNVWMWPKIEEPKWMAIWVKKNQQSRNRAGGWNAYEPLLCYKIKVDYDVWEFDILRFSVESPEAQHPVPKSIKPWSVILDDLAKDNRNVYDPFLGSGTTIVACEQTGRRGFGMEIEPKYVSVTLQRLQDMGLEPRLAE